MGSICMPTALQLRQPASLFPHSTALGHDVVHPRHLILMSDMHAEDGQGASAPGLSAGGPPA
eukprot:12914169-Prorocentrum_lima.AAC.1